MSCGKKLKSKYQKTCGQWNSNPTVALNPILTNGELTGATPEVVWDDPCANNPLAGEAGQEREIMYQFFVNEGILVCEIPYQTLGTAIAIGTSTHAGLVFTSTDEVTTFLQNKGVTINEGDTVEIRVFAKNCLGVVAGPSNIVQYTVGLMDDPLVANIEAINYMDNPNGENIIDGTGSIGNEYRVQIKRNGVVVYTSPLVIDSASIPINFVLENNDLVCVQSSNDDFATFVEDGHFIPTPSFDIHNVVNP